MTELIAMVSQKGGVGKSTLARLVAREFANAGWMVKIADLDVSQGTSFHWHQRRLENQIEPHISVERFATFDQARKLNPHLDLLIVDAPPHSNASTLRIAGECQLVVLPTGLSLDDLQPGVLLAHELTKHAIPKRKIVFALCRVGESPLEIEEAREYLASAGYTVAHGAIPEKIAYRRASDDGRAVNETRFPTLNQRSEELTQSLVDQFKENLLPKNQRRDNNGNQNTAEAS